jgi:hypothetical protein
MAPTPDASAAGPLPLPSEVLPPPQPLQSITVANTVTAAQRNRLPLG